MSSNNTDFFSQKVKNDVLTASRKREQIRIDFSGFGVEDYAAKADLAALADAVHDAADWIERESRGSAHEWKAKHNLDFPRMWAYVVQYNFGIKRNGIFFTVPQLAILSDRDTQPMVTLGRLESVLKFLSK